MDEKPFSKLVRDVASQTQQEARRQSDAPVVSRIDQMMAEWTREEQARNAKGLCADCERSLADYPSFEDQPTTQRCYFCAEETRVMVAEFKAAVND